jgi:hypothetical protein
MFFAGGTKILKGIMDSISVHPFSIIVGALSFTFKLEPILSMKVAASIATGLAPILLYLNSKLLANNEPVGLLTALVGAPVFLNLILTGDYQSVLGLVLFMYFVRVITLYTKKPEIKNSLPLIAISILFLVDFLLASALVAMLVVYSIYLITARKKLPLDLLALATALFFIALTLYGMNSEWLTIASMTIFKHPPLSAFSEESWRAVPLALSLLGAIAGLVYLYVEKKLDEFFIGLFLSCLGLCMVFVSTPFAIPLFLPLALFPISFLRQSYSVDRVSEEGEEITVINLEGEKLLSVLLSAITIISLLNYGYYVVASVPASYLSEQDLSDLVNIADWMMDNLTGSGLVAAPTHLGPLFEGFLGSRLMSWIEQENTLVANAMNETCFRIITQHLLVDELEPLSTSRSPLISAYDGKRYISLLYIDDSYTRVKLSNEIKEFHESPYGATFINHTIKEDEDLIELKLQFVTSNLEISKTIQASKTEPLVMITYTASNRTDVKLEDLVLPLWVDWGKGVVESVKSGSKEFLVLGSPSGYYSLEISFKNVSNGPTVAQSETGQEFVKGTFQAEANTIEAQVEVKVNFASPNEIEPMAFSIFDLQETRNVEYLLVGNCSPALLGGVEKEYEGLLIDDSFVRFRFTYDSWNYTEAPAYGTVIDEIASDGNTTRHVTYETAGLIIRKDLTFTMNNLTLMYHVEALNSSDPMFQGLIDSDFSIWIPWERSLGTFSYNGTEGSISLEVATINLTFYGDLSHFDVTYHSSEGQGRVFLKFTFNSLNTTIYSATIGVSITSEHALTMSYIETGRPVMDSSDATNLYVKVQPFKILYSSGRYVLLGVP